MNLSMLQKTLAAALLLVLISSAAALAAANVTVTASGDTSYSVQGSGMDGVAGIQLDINYDAASLSAPVVTKGAAVAGAMLAANTTSPGTIRIAIISTGAFSGSGQIATISFTGRTGTGGITSATVSMINTAGTAVAAQVTVPGSSSGGVIAGLSAQNQSTSTTQTGSGAPATSLGTVTLPADLQQAGATAQPPSPPPAVPEEITEPAETRSAEKVQPSVEPAVEAKPEETPQYIVYKGIMDRFQQYDGSKKFASVVAFFDKRIAQSFRQSPAIVISNGQDTVRVTIDIPARITSSPNFAVHGGTIISFHQEKNQPGRWVVEILPETGSLKVAVAVIAGAEEFDYPLTVAPPVKTALTLDEKGWETFIAETGTAQAPLHDFNDDGMRDYRDEYIFAANIIAKESAPEKPAAAAPPGKPLPAAAPAPAAAPKAGK